MAFDQSYNARAVASEIHDVQANLRFKAIESASSAIDLSSGSSILSK